MFGYESVLGHLCADGDKTQPKSRIHTNRRSRLLFSGRRSENGISSGVKRSTTWRCGMFQVQLLQAKSDMTHKSSLADGWQVLVTYGSINAS